MIPTRDSSINLSRCSNVLSHLKELTRIGEVLLGFG
jgi:hypothetical protein